MSTVVFMHIGDDVVLPTIMVRSVRRQNPDVKIVQVADPRAPEIAGVDQVARQPMTDSNIMLFRMRCFAALRTAGPTWYLDTDMICNRPLTYEGLEGPTTAVCLREFDCNTIFNHNFNGMNLTEYAGRTLGSLYPYIGCATLLNDSRFWIDCLANMEALEPKFFNWYGDQEAIRNIAHSGRYEIGHLRESIYACLPERESPEVPPIISHYKGVRKQLMLERAQREGLI